MTDRLLVVDLQINTLVVCDFCYNELNQDLDSPLEILQVVEKGTCDLCGDICE